MMCDVEMLKKLNAAINKANPTIFMVDNIVCQLDSQHDNDNLTEIIKELISFANTVKKKGTPTNAEIDIIRAK